MKSYRDYIWENGFPYGKEETEDLGGITYKIIKDGYEKRINVEKYQDGKYHSTLYDTLLLDFRKLNPREQKAWRKEIIEETEDRLIAILRDIDDRVIHKEICLYENGEVVEARTFTPHGQLLAISKLHANGVTLYDPEGKVVLEQEFIVS